MYIITCNAWYVIGQSLLTKIDQISIIFYAPGLKDPPEDCSIRIVPRGSVKMYELEILTLLLPVASVFHKQVSSFENTETSKGNA